LFVRITLSLYLCTRKSCYCAGLWLSIRWKRTV